jgi:uncharacterized protein CbrC (UPF0167 family)
VAVELAAMPLIRRSVDCVACGQRYMVVYEGVEFGPKLTVRIRCPHCVSGTSEVLVGTGPYRIEDVEEIR